MADAPERWSSWIGRNTASPSSRGAPEAQRFSPFTHSTSPPPPLAWRRRRGGRIAVDVAQRGRSTGSRGDRVDHQSLGPSGDGAARWSAAATAVPPGRTKEVQRRRRPSLSASISDSRRSLQAVGEMRSAPADGLASACTDRRRDRTDRAGLRERVAHGSRDPVPARAGGPGRWRAVGFVDGSVCGDARESLLAPRAVPSPVVPSSPVRV